MSNTIQLTKNHSFSNWFKTINASFLVAGTCIGGGMLALPISSSALGFFPSALLLLFACIFMTITGLLFLEATLWMNKESHIISLSKELLNKFGQGICWVVYLFICYASLIAYTSGGGKEIAFVFRDIMAIPFSNTFGSIIFLTLFIGIVYLGYQYVGRVNSILFIGLIISYIFMTTLAPEEMKFHLLKRQNWSIAEMFFIMPLMLTTFSFPGIVPTIVPYLKKDIKSIRIAIICGTSLTFIVYLIWLFVIFGTVPHEGQHGLQQAFLCDLPATECLHYAIENPLISYIAQFFAFFALTTSFLGIALALFDFLADGIHVSKRKFGKLSLIMLIAIPTLLIAVYYQRAFITALELSGGIGDSIISGLIPAAMIWNGRYKLHKKGEYRVKGGKALLVFVCLFSLSIFASEILRRF